MLDLDYSEYKQIFESTTNGIRVIDKDYNIIEVNKAYCNLFNLMENEAIGKKCYDLIGTSMCKTSDCPLNVILGGEDHAQYKMEIDHGNGTKIYYTSNISPLYDKDGKIIGIIEDFRDNIEYMRIVDELKIRESILASSINAIAVADLEGNLTYVNRSFLSMWEYDDIKEAFNKPISDYWQMGSSSKEALEYLFKRGKWINEGIIQRKDGSLSNIQILASMVIDEYDNPICIVTSFVDITELKKIKESKIRAQTALAIAKGNTDTVKSIMDAVVIAIAITDLDGKINRFNKGFTETFGFSSDVIGKSPANFVANEDVIKVSSAIKKCLENGHASNVECSAQTYDGKKIEVLIDLTLMKDSKDIPNGIIVVIRDITEQKQAIETQKHLSRELIHKNKELEQVIRIVSHDLRSPLVNIQGFSNELEDSINQIKSIIANKDEISHIIDKISPILNDDIPDMLKYILVSVSKIDSLLSGLLRISRLGRATLNIDEIDMNKIISDVICTSEYQIQQTNTMVEVGDLPSCFGDKNQINQVFSNLLNNALKYLDPNRKGKINIYGWNENGKSIYCVKDNGIGIAPEYQEKIFDMFYRINPSSTQGEGLGLNIVRKIIERHNGKIWVESKHGEGSKFFVSLPRGRNLVSTNFALLESENSLSDTQGV
ncbi:TPA: PAS domain-containing sensor histidine kinase [bacterium]|nr:PAS domain-containing sensor histidine kinase [bacterium]